MFCYQYKELECSLTQQAAEWVRQKRKEKKGEKTIRWAQVNMQDTPEFIGFHTHTHTHTHTHNVRWSPYRCWELAKEHGM